MGPRNEGVIDGGVAANCFGIDDAGGFCIAVFGVFDAVADAWDVGAKLDVADDEFEVGGLVGAVEFLGVDLGDDGPDSHGGFGAVHQAGGGVVCFGFGGFDVGDVGAPVG